MVHLEKSVADVVFFGLNSNFIQFWILDDGEWKAVHCWEVPAWFLSWQDLEKTSRHASSSLWTLFCKFGMSMVVPNMEISSFSSTHTHTCMDVECLCLHMKWLFNVCSLNGRTIFLFKNDRIVFCIYLIYMYLVVSNIRFLPSTNSSHLKIVGRYIQGV